MFVQLRKNTVKAQRKPRDGSVSCTREKYKEEQYEKRGHVRLLILSVDCATDYFITKYYHIGSCS